MKQIILAGAALLLALNLSSCKKSDSAPTKRELLTSGQWRMTASTTQASVPGFPAQPTDNYAALQACKKDDLYQFQSSGAWLVDEGGSKCDPAAPQQFTTGQWQLLENDTKFSLTVATSSLALPTIPGLMVGDNLTVTGDVLELTASALRVKGTTSVSVSNPLTGTPIAIPLEISQTYAKP